MSKHNNNLGYSLKRRCKCGRPMSIGEDVGGLGVFDYECPDCFSRRYTKPLTSEEYYNQFKR